MSGTGLNANQRRILETEGSLFISAGAGTGKTHAIVEKFFALIREPGVVETPAKRVDPLSIAAITFTKKAAGEMKERIIRYLERLADQPNTAAEAERMLNAMPFVWIDTIHGFCSRILREFSIEMDLDPSFEVMNEYRKERKIRGIVLRELDREIGERRPDMKTKLQADNQTEPQADLLKSLLKQFRLDGVIDLFIQALSRKRFDVWDIFAPRKGKCQPSDEAVKAFGTLFNKMLKTYEAECARDNAVDFEALLLYTLRLLEEHEAVRAHLADRFRAIIVDEFQDTNVLQKRILDCFAQNGKTTLIYVGDGKQSIYRFNGAEIGVFNLTREECDEARYITLEENYRSHEKLIDFYNRFFPKVFGLQSDRYGIAYEPLKAGETEEVRRFAEYAGRVRLLPKAQDFSEECFNVCAYITHLIRTENRQPKDFAVLLRTLTAVDAMTSVFEKYGLPYYQVGSANFYRRLEILSLLSLVRTLYNPADEYTLAQLLSSYLSPFAEEEILEMRKCDRRFLYTGLKTYVEEQGETHPEYRQFLQRIEALRARLSLRSVGELLREAIRDFDYDLYLASLPNGEKAWLNVKKLLEIADGFTGNASTREFLEQMAQESVIKEEEAALESESDDVVRLMTIHKAKGLQFPIVVLPNLGFNQNNQSPSFLTDWENRTIFFADKSEEEANEEYGNSESAANHDSGPAKNYNELKTKEKAREYEEKKRLLYVAMTRAKEEITLSFSEKPKKSEKKPSLSKRGFLPLLAEGGLVVPGTNWTPTDQSEYGDIVSLVPFDLEKVLSTGQTANEEEQLSEPADFIPETAFPLEDAPYQKYLSPSLLTSAEATRPEEAYRLLRKYEEKKVDDLLPELFKLSVGAPGYSEEVGTLVHKVLELYAEKDLSMVTRATVERLNRAFGYPASVVESAEKKIRLVADHPLFQVLRNAQPCFSEKPVRKLRGRHILSGTIDKLYFLEGKWRILDFKASRQNPLFIEKYRFQMRFYLYLVKELLRPAPEIATLFFLEERSTLDVGSDAGFEEELDRRIAQYEKTFAK
ncbi:MAG: UvrD-helicase domain-containing protein [Thermotogota bacterium]|nr:UvrD-helicase domain-containing protein [Thermotogota bacterium]